MNKLSYNNIKRYVKKHKKAITIIVIMLIFLSILATTVFIIRDEQNKYNNTLLLTLNMLYINNNQNNEVIDYINEKGYGSFYINNNWIKDNNIFYEGSYIICQLDISSYAPNVTISHIPNIWTFKNVTGTYSSITFVDENNEIKVNGISGTVYVFFYLHKNYPYIGWADQSGKQGWAAHRGSVASNGRTLSWTTDTYSSSLKTTYLYLDGSNNRAWYSSWAGGVYSDPSSASTAFDPVKYDQVRYSDNNRAHFSAHDYGGGQSNIQKYRFYLYPYMTGQNSLYDVYIHWEGYAVEQYSFNWATRDLWHRDDGGWKVWASFGSSEGSRGKTFGPSTNWAYLLDGYYLWWGARSACNWVYNLWLVQSWDDQYTDYVYVRVRYTQTISDYDYIDKPLNNIDVGMYNTLLIRAKSSTSTSFNVYLGSGGNKEYKSLGSISPTTSYQTFVKTIDSSFYCDNIRFKTQGQGSSYDNKNLEIDYIILCSGHPTGVLAYKGNPIHGDFEDGSYAGWTGVQWLETSSPYEGSYAIAGNSSNPIITAPTNSLQGAKFVHFAINSWGHNDIRVDLYDGSSWVQKLILRADSNYDFKWRTAYLDCEGYYNIRFVNLGSSTFYVDNVKAYVEELNFSGDDSDGTLTSINIEGTVLDIDGFDNPYSSGSCIVEFYEGGTYKTQVSVSGTFSQSISYTHTQNAYTLRTYYNKPDNTKYFDTIYTCHWLDVYSIDYGVYGGITNNTWSDPNTLRTITFYAKWNGGSNLVDTTFTSSDWGDFIDSKSITTPSVLGDKNYATVYAIETSDSTYDFSLKHTGITPSIHIDRIEVYDGGVSDDRCNVGSNQIFWFKLRYENNTTEINGNGSWTISFLQGNPIWNSTTFRWERQDSMATVGAIADSVSTVTDNLHGIQTINDNVGSKIIIWDRIKITNMWNDDNRRDIGTTATLYVTAVLEYDNQPIDGSDNLSLQGASCIWDNINNWWYRTDSSAVVQSITYDSVTATENTYNITVVNMNGKSTTVIWDKINVTLFNVDDSRIDVNTNGIWYASIIYAYDGTSLSGTVTSLLGSMTWNGSYWIYSEVNPNVIAKTNNITSITDSLYGLTVFDNSSILPQTIIWDKVIITDFGTDDSRIDINSGGTWYGNAKYAYDNTQFTGSISLNVGTMTWNGTMFIYQHVENIVTDVTAYITGITDSSYDLTVYDNSSLSPQTIIWDKIVVTMFNVEDERIPINTNGIWYTKVLYAYDMTELQGTVTSSEGPMTYNGTYWTYSESQPNVIAITNYIIFSTDTLYGLTVFDNSSISGKTIIWDRIIETIFDVSDNHCDIGTTQTIYITAKYEYDDTPFISGNIILNHGTMTYNGTHWVMNDNEPTVISKTYNVISVNDSLYNITAFYFTSTPTIIWDKVIITQFDIEDNRIDINSNGIWYANAKYAYDNTQFNGTISLNLGIMNWNGSLFVYQHIENIVTDKTAYITGITDNEYGLTVYDNSSVTNKTIIWDKIVVTMFNVEDERIPINTNGIWYTKLIYAYDNTELQGTVMSSEGVMVYNGSYWKYTESHSDPTSVTNYVLHATDSLYGLTAFDNSSVSGKTIIWDALEITIQMNGVSKDPIFTVYVKRLYDNSSVTNGTVWITFDIGTWSNDTNSTGYSTIHCTGGVLYDTETVYFDVYDYDYDIILNTTGLFEAKVITFNGSIEQIDEDTFRLTLNIKMNAIFDTTDVTLNNMFVGIKIYEDGNLIYENQSAYYNFSSDTLYILVKNVDIQLDSGEYLIVIELRQFTHSSWLYSTLNFHITWIIPSEGFIPLITVNQYTNILLVIIVMYISVIAYALYKNDKLVIIKT